MLRGINQQQIFEDSEDYEKFLQVLKDCKAISEFELYAYCLMGNHIHLLIKEKKEPIEQIVKRIGARFVYWYNIKHQRVGHLFQDRFKSEPVETDEYFLTVIRYIHKNPIKAGICKRIREYPYSSYAEYSKDIFDIIDDGFVFGIIPKEEFSEFNEMDSSELCLDIEANPIVKVTDEQAKNIIQQYSKCTSTADFQKLDIKSRDHYLKLFREKGLSIRQIARLTGISFSVVRKF